MTGHRPAAVALVVAVMAASACTDSATDIEAQNELRGTPLPVTGRLVDAAGVPLGGTTVVLNENRGIADFVFGFLFLGFTAGLSCLAGVDPCRLSGVAQTVTGDDGAFQFPPEDVAKARGRSNGVIFTGGDGRRGTVSVEFNPVAGGDLGQLGLWDPRPSVATGRGTLALRWDAPPDANSRAVVRGRVTDGSSAAQSPAELASFTDQGVQGSAGIDGRALEDRQGILVLTAGFSRPRAGQNPRVDWTAPLLTLAGAGAPSSRGAQCTLDDRASTACPLTDGDLSTPVGGRACTEPRPPATCATTAVVDLGRTLSDGIVAVRPSGGYRVEGSSDGTAYVALEPAEGEGAWSASLYAVGGNVRWVRIADTAGEPLDAAEVSMWPGGRAAGLPAVPSGEAPTQLPPVPTRPDDEGASRTVPIAVGIVLLILAAGGAVAVRLRRG